MRNYKLIVAVGLGGLTLLGLFQNCGSGGSSASSGAAPAPVSNSSSGSNGNSVLGTPGSNTLAQLQGSWTWPCNLIGTSFNILKLSVSGSTYTMTQDSYSDAGCSAKLLSHGLSGNVAVTADPVVAPSGATALNVSVLSETYTPATATSAAQLNSVAECGHTTWASGTTVDVTGSTCSQPSGTLTYGVFSISTNPADTGGLAPFATQMQTGLGFTAKSSDGKTAATRIQAYDTGSWLHPTGN